MKVINKACPILAEIAEEGKARSKEGRKAIEEYMQVFKEQKIENIILGCTHYPIYIPIIKEVLGYDVNLINTGKAVATYLKNYLAKEKQIKMKQGMQEIFLSRYTNEFTSIAKNILNKEFEILEK